MALNNLGHLLWTQKQPEAALPLLDRATAIRPDFADVHCNRGNVLVALERFSEAVESYDRALSRDPHDALAWSNRGNALWALKKPTTRLRASTAHWRWPQTMSQR